MAISKTMQKLGFNMSNVQWSWMGADAENQTYMFRNWQHTKHVVNGEIYVPMVWENVENSNGGREWLAAVNKIKQGDAIGFVMFCLANDPTFSYSDNDENGKKMKIKSHSKSRFFMIDNNDSIIINDVLYFKLVKKVYNENDVRAFSLPAEI